MSLSIIVLAAGKGSRMKSSVPKVFQQVGNKKMINHVLDVALRLNPRKIITVISDELEKYKKEINKSFPKVKFVTQKKRFGTAHAVKTVFQEVDFKDSNCVLVLYGDTPLIEYKTIMSAINYLHKNSLDLCVLSMKPKKEDHSYGRLFFEGNKLCKIIEKTEYRKNTNDKNICNSGMMVFNTNKLNLFINKVKNSNKKKEFYLTDLVNIFYENLLNIGHYLCDYSECVGVNTMSELSMVNKLFQEKKRQYFLKRGVIMEDPLSIFFSSDTRIGKNVKIEPNVYFGKGVNIKDNVEIKSFTHLENTLISSNVTIGPFARIRDNVEIGSHSKVGNFVEIKKSKIKKGVKISHLSYIGDAQIDNESNIGAGSITCNFDGKNKNQTFIGARCFIGSNTSLIAPIKIDKESIIGAGTIVNQNIKSNSLVYRKSELIKKSKK